MKKFLSIKTKMFFLFIPFAILIVLFLLFFISRVRNDIIKKIYLDNLSFTLKNVSLSLEFPLWTENINLIKNILSEIEKNKLIEKIVIYKKGKIFFILKKELFNSKKNYIILRQMIKPRVTSSEFSIFPKKEGSNSLIIFYINSHILNNEINRYFNFFLAFVLFLIFILILSFYFFVDSITIPIIDLSDEINQITKIKDIKKIKFTKRNDEIGRLANNFEKMQHDIIKYSKELEELNKTLEKKVRAKTEELNVKNEELQATVAQLKELNENYMNINKKLNIALKELYDAKEKAESANKAKSQFVSMISHELRTPLTSIIGYAQLLKNGIIGPINENQMKSIDNIENAAKDLLNLINDLIDVSKIDLKKFTINIQKVNLKDFIRNIEMEIEPLITSSNIEFKKNYQFDKKYIFMDPLRIKQVILNLLSNSLKFTQKGHISLHIIQVNSMKKNAVYDKKGKYMLFGIEDTGIGMETDEIDKVFKTFYQIDSGLNRNKSGTGLGLSICKQIISLHKGRIFAKSRVGKGSYFYFIIPIKEGRKG